MVSLQSIIWVFLLNNFSRVINLLLTKLARGRPGRILALGLFCTDLTTLGPYCQDLGSIFSQYGPRAWLIRYMYCLLTCKGPSYRTFILVSGDQTFAFGDFFYQLLSIGSIPEKLALKTSLQEPLWPSSKIPWLKRWIIFGSPGENSFLPYTALDTRKLERLSMTLTANGKNETFAVCLQLSVK